MFDTPEVKPVVETMMAATRLESVESTQLENSLKVSVMADGAEVNEATLREVGLVKGQIDQIKVLGQGDLTKALKVSVNQASASAKEKIEKAGGSIEL